MAGVYRNCFRPKELKIKENQVVYRTRIPIKSVKQLKPGDNICFPKLKGLYKHHAIVSDIVNSSRIMIIHLTGNSKDSFSSLSGGGKADICEGAIKFNENCNIYKYIYDEEDKHQSLLKGHNSLEIALKLKRYGVPKDYHLFKFNCEHLATYCLTGFPFSKQSDAGNFEAKEVLDLFTSLNDEQLQFIIEHNEGVRDIRRVFQRLQSGPELPRHITMTSMSSSSSSSGQKEILNDNLSHSSRVDDNNAPDSLSTTDDNLPCPELLSDITKLKSISNSDSTLNEKNSPKDTGTHSISDISEADNNLCCHQLPSDMITIKRISNSGSTFVKNKTDCIAETGDMKKDNETTPLLNGRETMGRTVAYKFVRPQGQNNISSGFDVKQFLSATYPNNQFTTFVCLMDMDDELEDSDA